MNNFNDLLPEEREPQYEELITLLKRGYRKPVPLSPTREAQVLERVRERLFQTELEDSPAENILLPQIGVLDSTPLKAVFPARMPQRDRRRFRLIALLAAALVIAALLCTPLLLMRFSLTSGTGGTNAYPTLTLSANAASSGSTVKVTLKHFSPSAHVVLTHDIQEPIAINGRAAITMNTLGSAIFPLVIDTTWGRGFHLLVAEDVSSHTTASTNLQITGVGPTPPAHLLIDTRPLAMGADIVGANTIRSFSLVNSGGGSISWSANSDASWLLVAPSQGIFSQQEVISVAVQRAGLKPGDYTGNITLSTNVSPTQHIEVGMTVRPLPLNSAPVLTLATALLSFTATDGQPNTPSQMLTISNPGSRPLQWALAPVQGLTCPWLGVTPSTGTIPPGGNKTLAVSVQSQCLLPGVYTGKLKFTASGAINSSQAVNVSLTVQPHCGLFTSTGYLAFTVVQGQHKASDYPLNLNTTASCAGTPVQWNSSSTEPWLMSSPENGVLRGAANNLVHIRVNAKKLMPGIHSGYIFFVTGHSTLTVTVELTVQAAPPLVSPIMGASPLSLNFSNIQGQANPTGQVVTITNNGQRSLSWHSIANPISSFRFAASPSGGTIAPGQSRQVTINVNTTNLTPGSYVGQVTINGIDANGNSAPGSPQIITVTLVVQPPCTIASPSSSVLSFSAVQGASANPPAQTIMFTGTGNCVWPVTWTTSVIPAAPWLTLTPSSGAVKGSSQSGSLGVNASIAGLPAGTYSTQVTVSASDASGALVQGSPQTFTVTLTVLPPCVLLSPIPGSLTFTMPQGQTASPVQNVTVSETGTCSRPVTWTASAGSSWLVPSATSGTDSGSGSTLGVSVNAATLIPGTYTSAITLTATDSTGATVAGSATVSVTLTVIGYTVSGTVVACPDQSCATPQPLAGATVTLLSGSTTVVTTADASGNYSFSGIASGPYTIAASGHDASNTSYTGTTSLTLTGNTNVTIQTFPVS